MGAIDTRRYLQSFFGSALAILARAITGVRPIWSGSGLDSMATCIRRVID